MPENFFGEDVAERYDEFSADMFDPAVVDPDERRSRPNRIFACSSARGRYRGQPLSKSVKGGIEVLSLAQRWRARTLRQ
jgi:hypothetical protein